MEADIFLYLLAAIKGGGMERQYAFKFEVCFKDLEIWFEVSA